MFVKKWGSHGRPSCPYAAAHASTGVWQNGPYAVVLWETKHCIPGQLGAGHVLAGGAKRAYSWHHCALMRHVWETEE